MRILLPAFCLGLAACATTRSTHPTAAVDAYVAALDAGDFARAYALMSATYRKEHPREEFERMMKDSAGDVRATAARLSSKGRKVDVSATLSYGDLEDELALVQEGGAWRIASDPLTFYPQDSPAHALRSFLRAVMLKRWDVALRFVPNEYKKFMREKDIETEFEGPNREDNSTYLQLLRTNLDSPIEQQGDGARMPFGDRYEVKFKREDGLWKIEDLY